MPLRPFKQVDVFAQRTCRGNPLAVVLKADGLDDATLARFANWTNLSETTFLLPPTHPDADYHARIFTTTTELPFAGHPTLGSCHAWLEAGGRPKRADVIVQQCGVGLVEIRRDVDMLAFAAPPLRRTGPLDATLLARLTDGLGLSPDDLLGHQWIVNGPQWIGLHLRSAAHVLAARPDYQKLIGLEFGLIGAYPSGSECDYEVRGLAYSDGPVEDPVTGSLNAGFAQWLIGAGIAPERYIAAQGTLLGRAGRVALSRDAAGTVWVGGATRTVIDGSVSLEDI
jgi:PhzF family phenazine biosynthesis protein